MACYDPLECVVTAFGKMQHNKEQAFLITMKIVNYFMYSYYLFGLLSPWLCITNSPMTDHNYTTVIFIDFSSIYFRNVSVQTVLLIVYSDEMFYFSPFETIPPWKRIQAYIIGKQDNIQHTVMTFQCVYIIQVTYVLMIILTIVLACFQRKL
jgi:hypothetical protein